MGLRQLKYVEETRIINRRRADELDERLSTITRPRPAKADNRSRRTAPVMDETPLSFESPESSTVIGATYNPENQELRVDLKTRPYLYADFPPELWREFQQAGSKGKFFSARIRPIFAGKPL